METMVIVLSQLVDFLQVVTDLSEVLAVPWPKAYFMFQSKLEILQFDVFSLPQVSCMTPSQTFYTTFRVFVIGTAALHALIWACFACGWVYTRLLPTSDGLRRLDKLRRVCLARSSFIMSLTLIVVTKSVINMYRCTNLQSAGFFLTRDLRIQCYTPAHTAARRTAALALLAYPVRGGLVSRCPGPQGRPHDASTSVSCRWETTTPPRLAGGRPAVHPGGADVVRRAARSSGQSAHRVAARDCGERMAGGAAAAIQRGHPPTVV